VSKILNRDGALGKMSAEAPSIRWVHRYIPTVVALLLLAGALAIWLLSLSSVDVKNLGAAGLPPALPLMWYVSLAIGVLGTAVALSVPSPKPWVISAYILVVIIVLYATVPAIADAPQYAWTYKHIGVIRLIEGRGTVSPNVDIYNRWPGFFALAAVFSRVTDVDPLSYAPWFEPITLVLDVTLVAAIAQTIIRDIRVTGCAALLFAISNWVGQNYLSPQALAYTLDLALMLIVVRQLTPGRAIAPSLMQGTEFLFRRSQADKALSSALPWSKRTSLLLLIGIDAVIIATHQLTPYIVVLQVGALTVIGVVRPRWLVLLLGAMTLAYLLPNLSYVSHHYGLFSGLNPIDNAQVEPGSQTFRDWFHGHVGQILSYTVAGLTGLATIRLIRRGQAQRVLPLAVLAAIPFLVLFGQSYGGEASLRVFLFSSPWRDIIISWGLSTLARRIRLWAYVSTVGVIATLFIFAFFGNAGTNVMPKTEVNASEHFYMYAPAGSVLMLAGEDFPLRVGSRYARMAGPGGDHSPDILENFSLRRHVLGSSDIPTVIAAMRQYARNDYIVFSATELMYADVFGTTPKGSLTRLKAAIAKSPHFGLWYATPDAEIYTVVK
jgi:hypothetical protein